MRFLLIVNKIIYKKIIWRVAKKWRIFNVVDVRVNKKYIIIRSFLKKCPHVPQNTIKIEKVCAILQHKFCCIS